MSTARPVPAGRARGGRAPKKAARAERRSPRQHRAQATVDAILEGATRVLVAAGFEGINTNSVAAAAGVSIGSLYQYFANKDEILAMVIDRHCGMMAEIVTKGLQEYAGAPIEAMVRGLIHTVISAQQAERGFFRVLREQLPRSSRFSRIDGLLDNLAAMLSMTFAARAADLRIRNPGLAGFLVVHAVDGVTSAMLTRPADDQEYQALVKEIGDLVLLYLQGSHPSLPPLPTGAG